MTCNQPVVLYVASQDHATSLTFPSAKYRGPYEDVKSQEQADHRRCLGSGVEGMAGHAQQQSQRRPHKQSATGAYFTGSRHPPECAEEQQYLALALSGTIGVLELGACAQASVAKASGWGPTAVTKSQDHRVEPVPPASAIQDDKQA